MQINDPVMLTGKVAIVTGAGRGIGRGIAVKLAQRGADVAVVDINEESARSAADDIALKRGNTVTITKNVFQQLVESGATSLGGADARAMWKEAIEVERKSEQMYREAAEKEADETRRALWNKIADEEKNHIYLIDNMMSFLADPQSFVQSAQYSNFMSWEGH